MKRFHGNRYDNIWRHHEEKRALKIAATSPRDWRAVQWMTFGIGIKRWGLLALIGLLMTATGLLFGLAYVAVDLSVTVVEWIGGMTHQLVETETIGWFMFGIGMVLFLIGLRGTLKSVEIALAPGHRRLSRSGFAAAQIGTWRRVSCLRRRHRTFNDAARPQALHLEYHGDCHDGR